MAFEGQAEEHTSHLQEHSTLVWCREQTHQTVFGRSHSLGLSIYPGYCLCQIVAQALQLCYPVFVWNFCEALLSCTIAVQWEG